jgi:LmbE family N-acetylglucosaminyl deacetylase
MTDAPLSPSTPPLAELEEDFGSVLCVVAHPDDIEYGTAAAVARWTAAGTSVAYFLLTRGEAGIDTMAPEEAARVREQEERDGAALVGVDEVDFGTHRDGVVEYGLALRRDIAREIRRRRPDVVVTGDYHDRFIAGMLNQADHRAVGLATADAVADAGNRWIFPELLDEGLEPWHVRRLCFAGSPSPTHYVDVTGHLDTAVASLEAHRAYNDALPDTFPSPAELVGMILGGGGQAAGVQHAVLFDVIERR